jgi:hypothetical protein
MALYAVCLACWDIARSGTHACMCVCADAGCHAPPHSFPRDYYGRGGGEDYYRGGGGYGGYGGYG